MIDERRSHRLSRLAGVASPVHARARLGRTGNEGSFSVMGAR
jgi:hypothetical protein